MNNISEDTQSKIWRHFQNEYPDSFKEAQPRLDYILNAIRRQSRSASPRVLNIGAGDGYLEITAQRRNMRIFTLDLDKATVKRLAQQKIQAFQGYIQKMPFENAQFDFVTASEVLEHLNASHLEKGLQEVARVLKPQGGFIGTVPYKEDIRLNRVVCPDCGKQFHRWGHERAFDRAAMRAELSPYFENIILKRRAFASLRRQSFTMLAKNMVRLILGPFGAPLASPNLFFKAQKK